MEILIGSIASHEAIEMSGECKQTLGTKKRMKWVFVFEEKNVATATAPA
jgi:hypothetical protein